MKNLIISVCFLPIMASAAKLENVRLLGVRAAQENIELKLQPDSSPKDSFFYVDVIKSDPESFEKLVHVIRKLKQQDDYRLDLNIPSFSASPSGSYYQSQDIVFLGHTVRETNNAKANKKAK